MITCTFTGPTPEALEVRISDFSILRPILRGWAVAFLQREGYVVEMPREWERPQAFCARVGICQQTLIRKLRDPRRPNVDVQRGNRGQGRVKFIASNTRFDAFCRDGKPTAHDSTAAPAATPETTAP